MNETKDIDWWQKYKKDILDVGLDTECGTVVGLSEGLLEYKNIKGKHIPVRTKKDGALPQAAYDGCAARLCNYPELNEYVFKKQPKSWLCGVVEEAFIGHAANENIRRTGASGGILSAILIHLLESKEITGAVCMKTGNQNPWESEPFIAHSKEEILECAGSVYSATPMNTILSELENEDGPLAYIGLPDQIAAIRKLQRMDHPSVRNIKYVFGPYTGTQMSFEAIKSFLRSNGVRSEDKIKTLKYRAGEWPGHLQIELKDGRILQAEKFHYNYLIPFFITSSSLQIPDFTNELTDISVGDAWSPKYEEKRGGYSVVLARSEKGVKILKDMQLDKAITIENIPISEALDMHGHMLDFKKRGSFIRNNWKKVKPEYGYKPAKITDGRKFVEWCMRIFFGIGKLAVSRWIVEHIPLKIVGPCFNVLRKSWKSVSRPTKRKNLRTMEFIVS